uniref:THAP-type domain-containing protein n=1 Tax=Sander lucioperca TaxID=283035 RepID=A0A8D0CPL0_SANLU
MPDSCCAIGCTNHRGEKPGLCFYRIPSDKENPERRQLWIQAIRRATVSGNGTWQPSQYTRLCSDHFIKGAKSDDLLSPDWVPSVFSHTPVTKKRKREKDMESRIQIKRMEAEKKQDAIDVLLELSSGEPVPQQCFSNHCKDAIAKLQQECDDLREENRRLKTNLGTLDEQALANDDLKVKALTGLPTRFGGIM